MADDALNLIDEVRQAFSKEGPLSHALGAFEDRPQQRAMAEAVAQVLGARQRLFVEAGTGVGKTLAYLVPAVLSGLRVVVSTSTKPLQDQLLDKDLRVVAASLGAVDAQVLKGRAAYLCRYRFDLKYGQWASAPPLLDRALWHEVVEWQLRTTSGDLAELRALPEGHPWWAQLSATPEQCHGGLCARFDDCFSGQSRRRAQKSQLVIVNHALYLADALLRREAGDDQIFLIPEHDVVIFDEAHDLEAVSIQNLGLQLAAAAFEQLAEDTLRIARAAVPMADMQKSARALFEAVRKLLGAETRALYAPAQLAVDCANVLAALSEGLALLGDRLRQCEHEQAPHLAQRAHRLRGTLHALVGIDGAADQVFFAESQGGRTSLRAQPATAQGFAELLGEKPAIFVSATLTTNAGFAHFREQLGLAAATELVLDSPFDFASQAGLYLARDMPAPDHPDFRAQAVEEIRKLVAAAGGGALVLCTSHKMVEHVRAALDGLNGRHVRAQGEMPRTTLLEEFRSATDGVLVATMSFWKGVDVSGWALRLVIMDKLPFAAPTDPLVQARLAHLQAQGKDPFLDYQVPQAALLLRQGFGRLIRSQADVGLVALLDSRIHTRHYGRLLLARLPPARRLYALDEACAFMTELVRRRERSGI